MTTRPRNIWDELYDEEYDGLTNLITFEILTKAQCDALLNRPKAISTMCVLAVKVDESNRPIIILGNLEDRACTKADC
jgi:hypothetical protein